MIPTHSQSMKMLGENCKKWLWETPLTVCWMILNYRAIHKYFNLIFGRQIDRKRGKFCLFRWNHFGSVWFWIKKGLKDKQKYCCIDFVYEHYGCLFLGGCWFYELPYSVIQVDCTKSSAIDHLCVLQKMIFADFYWSNEMFDSFCSEKSFLNYFSKNSN